MDRVCEPTFLVGVVGSAVAVARPIVRRRQREGLGDATRVYLGVRSSADVPIERELEEWARAGARVTLCLSRSNGAPSALAVRPGWVQQVLAEDVRAGQLPDAVVFAAGPKAMLDEVRALAAPEVHAHLGAVALEVVTNT
jgi:NAD(P)H-flavin reductase